MILAWGTRVLRKILRAILTEYAREHRVKPLIYCASRQLSRPWPKTRATYYLNPKLSVDTAIVMPIYNRPEYLTQTYDSLLKTNLERAVLIMVDDGSDDTKVLKNFYTHTNHIKIYKNKNIGMWHSFIIGFDLAIKNFNGIKYLVTLDSDTIHKPNWLDTTIELYKSHQAKKPLVTGFNANTHVILEKHENYALKSSVGGLNLLFSPEMYKRHFRSALHWHQNWWDYFFVDIQHKLAQPIITTRPSVVDHIGRYGRNSSVTKNAMDVALDFDEA